MHLTSATSPRMARRSPRSTSLSVLEHETDMMHIVDHEDIIGLTQDVKNFSDGLAKLKTVFNEPCECDEELRVLAHERLGDVLSILKAVLQKYPPLNTTELFSAAGTLIGKIKTYNYEDHTADLMESAFSDAIDQLALEFSSSVSDYLMGDLQQQGYIEEIRTKSYDNLLSVSTDTTDKDDTEEEKDESVAQLTPEQIDETLMSLQAGLELAFQRAKAWSKYLKDVMAYIERRAQLEVEYSKNLARLAASVKPSLTEEGFLPLQSVYCTVLSQDVEFSKTCQATFTLLQTTKFIEPLTGRRNEHDKVRKNLKEAWNKEVKKMQEAVTNYRKAHSLYIARQQDYEKARELSQKVESEGGAGAGANQAAKVDKRKKAEDDACHKAAEAETTYKACVAEANSRQCELQRVRGELLAGIREQILLSDQIIKKVTIDYFQLLQTVSAPVPVQYHTLCEASKRYEAGSQYAEYVRRLPASSTSPVMQYEDFKFESYNAKGDIGNRKVSTQSNESVSSDHHSHDGSPNMSPRRDKYRVPVKAWTQQGMVANSDTDSQSGSSKSLDSSPSNSPYPSGHKKMVLTGSLEDLIEDERGVPHGVKQLLAVPGTEQVDVQSILRRQGRRRNTTFGVDFQEQVEHYHSAIPPIITKCLKEVEKRGITVKGIYRVSGVKSTVENLCQKFELDPESVTLEDENPNVISNVLKLYLRQLPEPLLTFKLYPNFVQTAKESMSSNEETETTTEKLHNLIDRLPFSNRKTCGVLMHHLQRVASFCDQNHMTASNLGIVFGPTLLRPQGGNASLACLVDTPHQTRVVELLIVNAESLFGPNEDHQVIPGETVVEAMEKKGEPQPSQPQNSTDVPKPEQLPKSESKKEKISSSEGPEQQVIPPNIPQSQGTPESSPTKRAGEELVLPGSTNYDKKEPQPKSTLPNSALSPSDGEEDVATGLDTEQSAESDILSDDDLLLPDDSHQSQNARHDIPSKSVSQYVEVTSRSHGDFSSLTPPLSARHTRKGLSSPASSPSLSARTSFSSPPTIRIDSLQPMSDRPPLASGSPSSLEQRVYQLPPINSWMPKSDVSSLFNNGILDTRSPQIYRRTTQASTKTSSFPQSSGSSSSGQASRVSWPQSSQLSAPSTGQDSSAYLSDSETTSKQPCKSPKLLQKCSSFDQERSKPFPARSIMSSPLLVRKSASYEDTDTALPTNKLGSGSPVMSKRTSLKDVQEFHMIDSSDIVEDDSPQCASDSATMTTEQLASDTISGGSPVEFTGNVSSLDDEKGSENVTHAEASLDNLESRGKVMDQGAKGKTKSKVAEKATKPKDTYVDKESKISADARSKTRSKRTPTKSESDKSSNQSKTGSPEVKKASSPKSTTSSVKSAILTSAAKLKSLGKRSPVTLLSYRSKTITVPDQADRSQRHASTSCDSTDSPTRRVLVRQSGSSPSVLVSNPANIVHDNKRSKADKKMSEAKKVEAAASKPTRLCVKTEQDSASKKQQKSKLSPMKEHSPGLQQTAGSSHDRSRKKDPWVYSFKPDGTRSHTPVPLAQSYSSEQQEKGLSVAGKPPHAAGSNVSQQQLSKVHVQASAKGQQTVTGSSTGHREKEKKSKVKEDRKPLVRQGKRDSISSVHSDASRHSDKLRDCCHGRKK